MLALIFLWSKLSLPKYTPEYESLPRHKFVEAYKSEIQPFHRLVWDNVVRKLFVLFAIILELPENYFVERHEYSRPSEDHLRYVCSILTLTSYWLLHIVSR